MEKAGLLVSDILKQIAVSELMSIKVFSISSNKTVEYAKKLMQSKHFGGLPIVEDGKLVGIVTHKDISKVQLGRRNKTKVKDIMTKQVVTIFMDEKASTALEKMSELRVMRMPVISNSGALVGIITLTDIDKASKKLQKRQLSTPKALLCPRCGAPLKITINRTVRCEYCGEITSL